ncbi:hypothetical protein WJX77_011879 [Trebouxia sp. C0004]
MEASFVQQSSQIVFQHGAAAGSSAKQEELAKLDKQVANRAIAQQIGGRRRHGAQRLSRGAPRRPLLSALVPLVTLHANFDDSEEFWPSSKIVNRKSRQRRFNGKTAKVDWKQSIGKARRSIRTAIVKSRSTQHEDLVRAIACAFLDEEHGLQACAAGYLLPPVSYSLVAWYIRQNTELQFEDDFDNLYASGHEGMDEQDMHNSNGQNTDYPFDEGNDMPNLTTFLDQDEFNQFFTVLHSPDSNLQNPRQSQPYVIADLHALIKGNQLQKVQDVLSQTYMLTVHPEDPAYETELRQLTVVPSKPET